MNRWVRDAAALRHPGPRACCQRTAATNIPPIFERPGYRWPNGAGLAVYFALGIEDYAFDEGLAENMLPGVPAPDVLNTSWRDYGNRVGAWRLLNGLTRSASARRSCSTPPSTTRRPT